ncbi:hypothetical protein NPIL_602851 [Nephila pilipes]|uniref:Uncharacterized protein n=1 Tax=Nephila pilipes TaxID=299642 RepID=A0A8X6TF65_NEPPI|nr:hypothetical protein NPIL_602851 [Nephila pilipes]
MLWKKHVENILTYVLAFRTFSDRLSHIRPLGEMNYPPYQRVMGLDVVASLSVSSVWWEYQLWGFFCLLSFSWVPTYALRVSPILVILIVGKPIRCFHGSVATISKLNVV